MTDFSSDNTICVSEETVANFAKEVTDSKGRVSVVYDNSKLFKVGDYPDKNFSLSDEEMEKAVSEYTQNSAEIDYAHCPFPGPLDGKMGTVSSIRKEGDWLFGSVSIPKWLDDVLPKDKKVSCEWSRGDKNLVGLALVTHPRVEGAELMSIFNASQEAIESKVEPRVNFMAMKYEKNPMQKVHDMCACMGAECPGKAGFSAEDFEAKVSAIFADTEGVALFGFDKEDLAEFMTPDMLKSVQEAHDHSKGSGASCTQFANRVKAGKQLAHGYYGTGDYAPFSALKENDEMNEQEQAEFTALKAERDNLQTKLTEATATTADFTNYKTEVAAQLRKKDEEAVEFTAQIVSLQTAMDAQKADAQFSKDEAFIDRLVTAGKMTPAEKDKHVELAKNKPVVFADMRELLEAREPYAKFSGAIIGGSAAQAKYEGGSDAYAEFSKLRDEKMATNPGMTKAQASVAVATENKELGKAAFAQDNGSK